MSVLSKNITKGRTLLFEEPSLSEASGLDRNQSTFLNLHLGAKYTMYSLVFSKNPCDIDKFKTLLSHYFLFIIFITTANLILLTKNQELRGPNVTIVYIL